jgi:hypothetical protein
MYPVGVIVEEADDLGLLGIKRPANQRSAKKSRTGATMNMPPRIASPLRIGIVVTAVSNDEVERLAITENEVALSQSFDLLIPTSKLRPVAPTDC